MTDKLKVCEKCGGDSGYLKSVRVNGWVTYMGDGWNAASRADEEETSNDNLRYTDPKTVICLDCGKRVPHP